jgi:hypothetical protein
MARLTTIIVCLCLSGIGFGQSPASLGQAQAVDIRAAWVDWNPAGDCLAYTREADSGTAIGLYPVGASQGSPLLHLKKDDVWNLQWFESQDAAIVMVTNSDTRGKRFSVFLLEAQPASATKLFEETAAPGESLSIDANLSPLLEHAIFALRKGDSIYHLVLPLGGTSLIRSTDLDEAESEHLIGPKWGASGTAFYLDRPSADASLASVPPGGTPQDQLLKAIMSSEVDSLTKPTTSGDPGRDQQEQGLARSLIQSIRDRLTPAPPVGDPSLELKPDNAVLRRVKSPGPWKEPDQAVVEVTPHPQPANVTAGQLTGSSQSLWLIAQDKSWAVLVAPSAQNSWLSPTGKAIAYSVNGALFVRTIALATFKTVSSG